LEGLQVVQESLMHYQHTAFIYVVVNVIALGTISIRIYMYLHIYLFTYLFIYLHIYLFIYLFIHLFTYLFIYLFI